MGWGAGSGGGCVWSRVYRHDPRRQCAGTVRSHCYIVAFSHILTLSRHCHIVASMPLRYVSATHSCAEPHSVEVFRRPAGMLRSHCGMWHCRIIAPLSRQCRCGMFRLRTVVRSRIAWRCSAPPRQGGGYSKLQHLQHLQHRIDMDDPPRGRGVFKIATFATFATSGAGRSGVGRRGTGVRDVVLKPAGITPGAPFT